MYSACSGKFQSPINIDMKDVLHVKLPPLRFEGFDEELEDAILTNNGHTVMVSPKDEDSDDVKVKGGPLKGAYVFKQMHFHWGMNDSLGSEDSINNQSFPMELHMVFWKESYGSYEKAIEHKDGLTVMAFFYEITMNTNKAYKPLISALEEVKGNHSNKHMEDLPALKKLLPQDRVHYYYYQGSLTTPPCDEIVTWIDFTESIPLSPDQVNQFRRIMDQNHRPTQPVGERTIWFNVGPGELIMPYQQESSATTAASNKLSSLKDCKEIIKISYFQLSIFGWNILSILAVGILITLKRNLRNGMLNPSPSHEYATVPRNNATKPIFSSLKQLPALA
ncbi:hypothetical protein J437_LFUL007879 [Ladona fulva]|uniref:Alpha-carbonic anhydrase domain-containing protein n=1 Tax=Ladona fulva TaxID=123851 RepID=A0A8K0K216_LADFU|nr:hypothetical protein J437_LFUL007879 [Ladona fulva]